MFASRTGRGLIGAFLLLGVTAFALETAKMDLPESLARNAERLAATGFGGFNRGRYELGPYRGEFTRIESRWAVFDPLYASNRAKSSFSLQGPRFDAAVTAECEMKKANVTIGVVTFDPKKMTYQCSFQRGGQPIAASFVLGEAKPENMRARLASRAERHGEAMIEGLRVSMRSVHRYAGSRWQSRTPVGYLLEIDEQLIGAIELTDVNPTLFLDPAAGEARDAALIAAMALAVLRDPEESDLGE